MCLVLIKKENRKDKLEINKIGYLQEVSGNEVERVRRVGIEQRMESDIFFEYFFLYDFIFWNYVNDLDINYIYINRGKF